MKKFPIILLSGYSGAGKSTLGSTFSDKFGLDFIEHQGLIHGIAKDKGYERGRHWLAEVGVEQFAKESVDEMVKIIKGLEGGTKGIMTDVAYGEDMIANFKKNFPEAELIIVSVFADPATREVRIGQRMGGVEREIAHTEKEFRDGFLSEVGLGEILNSADLIIENTGTIDEAVLELKNKLEQRGWAF